MAIKDRVYFKGLDGLRAIASISVVLGHIELIKKENGIDNVFSQIGNLGSLGVNLFFVLSGFLITTLLLKEKQGQSKINLKNFYIRRILRIWPLYFIILLLSTTIFLYAPNWLTLILCGTIFPNIAHALSIGWTYSPQIWSIGVEEQFYLFWPTILKRSQQFILIICISFIVFYPFAPHFLQFIFNRLGASNEALIIIEKVFGVLSFNAMATGALFSILYFSKKQLFTKIISYSSNLNKTMVILPFLLWFSGVNFSYFQTPIYSLLFAYMMVVIVNGTFQRFFELKILKFLGKISYGIYMYHWMITLLLFEAISPLIKLNYGIGNILLYSTVLILTICISFLSYQKIEKPIQKLKRNYSNE
tara:strand:- start:343 stop:1425 length:1083 start_codon:yes stop_codon:yes gene_type:complete